MDAVTGADGPTTLSYEADLCGNIEQALKALQGYGLMALELIQNADDAGASSLTFDVRPDALVIRNDADFSSCGLSGKRCPWEQSGDPGGIRRPCNFHAIAKMGSRSKVFASDQIGRFGIGFVSVYQVTDTPLIRSAGIQLELNPLTGQAPTKKAPLRQGTEFELPWASSETEIRQALNASPTPEDVGDRFISELAEVLRSSLLFLRHLTRVTVLRDKREILSVEIERSDNEVTLKFQPDNRHERWVTLRRDADDIIVERSLLEKYSALAKLDRSTMTTVALRVGDPVEGLLYAYLPTQQKTDMPVHINADFFPHASRQHIVLQGEGHERYWNEALLAAAAATLAENFELLKQILGPKHLWELLEAAFKLREGAFSEFWTRLAAVAIIADCVWTSSGEWRSPGLTTLPPEQMQEKQRAALSHIAIHLVDKTLRPHWTVLSTLGASELRLTNVADALEALGSEGLPASDPHLKNVWSAVALMIDLSRLRTGFEKVLDRLTDSTFLLDIDNEPASPAMLWRVPAGVRTSLVRKYIPDCPIVHQDVATFPDLYEILDLFGLDELSTDLGSAISDVASAEELIGTQPEGAKTFYSLLTSFPRDQVSDRPRELLCESPILRTPDGFVTPSRGQLPGGFHDPVGHFTLLDASLLDDEMYGFAREVLGVSVLSFRDYIAEHLEQIVGPALTRDQYQSLLEQIVAHKTELGDDGTLDVLADRAFVRTRSGAFVRPGECYYKSAGGIL